MSICKGPRNHWVPHHQSGNRYYAYVPDIDHRLGSFSGGPVELRVGRYGQAGFGVNHIWQRHSAEVLKHARVDLAGLTDDDKVALVSRFVGDIAVAGVSIHSEFENIRGNHRLQVLKSRIGIAVLQGFERKEGTVYSVVTAYSVGQARGRHIGTLMAMP